MSEQQDRQPELRTRAAGILATLSQEEREALLIKCWMSHDARWFMAVAQAFGLEAANRLNQVASHEEGKVEAYRIMGALQIPPSETADDYLLLQETIITLLGPELLEYQVVPAGDDSFEIRIQRCFAHENVARRRRRLLRVRNLLAGHRLAGGLRPEVRDGAGAGEVPEGPGAGVRLQL